MTFPYDACPHCGSEDYGPVNEGNERCCLTCGYDTENGTTGVCPGGLHPRDGQLCCDACWKRVPTDLPGAPKWRSARRSARRMRWWHRMEDIDNAVIAWLGEHPR